MDSLKQIFTDYQTPIYIAGILIILMIVLRFVARKRVTYQVQFVPGAFRHGMRGMRGGFEEAPKDEKTKVVVFFAPWCPHCKHFMDGQESLWEKLKQAYSQRADLLFDQVNGDEQKDLAKKMEVDGYPTILKIKKGKVETFVGDRTLDALSAFVDA
jgi:thiol-disulfide isomerase/thioredoxin|uniref:Thioredoxin domain-containing protein n=1 Tax=viral metagenome TaxID=1070528 RepID=A0A6C0BLY8_9ZZZZ